MDHSQPPPEDDPRRRRPQQHDQSGSGAPPGSSIGAPGGQLPMNRTAQPPPAGWSYGHQPNLDPSATSTGRYGPPPAGSLYGGGGPPAATGGYPSQPPSAGGYTQPQSTVSGSYPPQPPAGYLSHQQQQQQQPPPPSQGYGSVGAAGGPPPYHGYPPAAAAVPAPPPAPAGYPPAAAAAAAVPPPPHLYPRSRLPANRPVVKLSVSLIDTYKHINAVYYEEREARRRTRAQQQEQEQQQQQAATGPPGPGGSHNNGWDDDNYDYIITSGEIFYGRYKIKERIGKGSFGQVVRAEDEQTNREVAIKIIKSKRPFALQAKTEIELLTHLVDKDGDDQHNIVRLLTHFVHRNHQCLVFEMLSLNLYELLKNTQFGGVSLNLIRKFAKQVLKALSFLARKDVDIIHCDLKPENILLRHPKKSGVKVIDFGSSCRSNKRMYSYIQSRFYRSPEVMLGLPYSVAIDMWSLGCILAEMHTGEPLFSGSDQFDQMQKIVKLLGMVPDTMLDRSGDQVKNQFFERRSSGLGRSEWTIRQSKPSKGSSGGGDAQPTEPPKQVIVPSANPIASLTEILTAGSRQKKKFPPSEQYNSQQNYELFIDLIYQMLAFEPEQRINPDTALEHPFITGGVGAGGADPTGVPQAAAYAPR